MTNLHGSHVVIMGGSSGMGLATARLVMEHGATVTIASRSPEKLRQAADYLGDVRTIVADITREADVAEVFRDLERVDHIFISAGRFSGAKIMEADMDTFRSEVSQRFWGPLYVIRHGVPKMREGSITLLTGQLASRPAIGSVVTAALHAALETLTQGLALELAPIRVNSLAAGAIDTPLWDGFREELSKAGESLPVKRVGTTEDVAGAVVLLMTNGFITGEVLHVDGGGRWV